MGKALGFYASQRISMRRVKLDSNDHITAEEGLKINCKTIKNRFCKGNPFRTCSYYAIYNKGIDNDLEVINILERNESIQKNRSWFSVIDNKNNILNIDGKVFKWQGKTNLLNDFKNDKVVRDYLLGLVENLDGNASISLDADEIEKIKKDEENLNNEMKNL